jgi:signal transduction histidine kinase
VRQRTLFPPRLGARLLYLLLTLPIGAVYFGVLLGGLLSAVGGAFIIGIPLFVGLMFLWRWLARLQRRWLRRLLELDIEEPYRALTSPTRLGRVRDRIVDPATWKDLAYLLLLLPLGLVSTTICVCLLGATLGFLTLFAWGWAIPGGIDVLFFQVDTVWEGAIAGLLAVPAWLLLLVAVRALCALHAGVARALLTPSPDPAMIARVSALQDSRARIIAAADAERRRLERDLHDGAQQRLVALSMSLGLAKRRMAKGEDAADLVMAADAELQAAITELRDLARGIHPAVLTDRGLAAALGDLANRSAVPVQLDALPDERLPDAVEAAAYFTVSEALTNVAKYARASAVLVAVAPRDGRLEIRVSDDGVGGAASGGGSGLRGLADRLAALGGELDVVSPPGAGTRLIAAIPLEQPLAEDAVPAPPPRRARGELARRVLQSHAVVYAAVMALLVFIWLTTGGGYFWPQWPIAGWGFVLALHAWFAQGGRRGMLAAETQPDP